MPAIASFYVHASAPGVRMSDIGLRGDEDFLLVHAVEDSAEYLGEEVVYNTSGKRIYHCLKDPVLTFSFDADCLAFERLANCHPGTNLHPSMLNNLISGAFGFSLGVGTEILYRRPRRQRSAANLAHIQFDIECRNAGLAGVNINPTSWAGPSPAEILVHSLSTAYPDVPSVFGCSIFWRRRATLDFSTAPALSGTVGHGLAAETTDYMRGKSAAGAQPANLAAFIATVDSIGETGTDDDGAFYGRMPSGSEGDDIESEIVEVYHVPSGTHWLSDPTGNQIPGLLISNIDPRTVANTTVICARWLALWNQDSATPDFSYIDGYYGDEANLAGFLATNNDGELTAGGRTLLRLWDAKAGAWAYDP